MNETTIVIGFPDAHGPEANVLAESLLEELRQAPELRSELDREKTRLARGDQEAMDFGATLLAVLGTHAVLTLAQAVKSWAERKGQTSIEMNGVRIENLRSQDAKKIVAELERAKK